jgi:acetylornithine deacetylase/succinyl-diaminopimelate desuccinylase-like protein
LPEREDLERRASELLQQLIRFNTVNPPGNEDEAQHFLAGLLGDAGFKTELLASVEGRPNLIATLKAASDGPSLVLLGHVDTVLADPGDWTNSDPWSGEVKDGEIWGRGALDMKSQVAAEIAAAVALAEEGWRPQRGELKVIVTADEEAGAEHGAQFLCEQHADKVRCDLVVNEGAGQVIEYDGRRVYGVCAAEKGVFRFTLTTRGRAGHASLPKIGDNALAKMAPVLDALRQGQPAYELSPEPEGLINALGLDPDDLEDTVRQIQETDPRVAVLIEPMLGVTLTPTMISASEKINVIPARADLKVDCRVPPELGEEHALKRIREVVGDNGFGLEFAEKVVGNRSPVDTPLMEHIRGFIAEEEPGAEVAPVVLPGFSDSHWFRRAFPDCVAYGFFPQRKMDLFEAAPLIHGADERIPVEDVGMAARFYAGLIEETLN